MQAFITLVLYIVIFTLLYTSGRKFRSERDVLQKRLDDLAKKSQLEQELSLATTDQLMKEVASRFPGFIFLLPTPTNKQNESGMSIHIKGMPPHIAVMTMSMACQVINSGQPPMEQMPKDEGV